MSSSKYRIIPTRMGTRSSRTVCRKGSEDHPHAYGDKVRQQDKNCPIDGSSPRVWGQVVVTLFKRLTVRIIPTRMGTSVLSSDPRSMM